MCDSNMHPALSLLCSLELSDFFIYIYIYIKLQEDEKFLHVVKTSLCSHICFYLELFAASFHLPFLSSSLYVYMHIVLKV